jgi:hypothetical protein
MKEPRRRKADDGQKCDALHPTCTPCLKSRTYEPFNSCRKRSHNMLSRDKACLPCTSVNFDFSQGDGLVTPFLIPRHRKRVCGTLECRYEFYLTRSQQKCDAVRPTCGTCQNSRKKGCVYYQTTPSDLCSRSKPQVLLLDIPSDSESLNKARSSVSTSSGEAVTSPTSITVLVTKSRKLAPLCVGSAHMTSSVMFRRTLGSTLQSMLVQHHFLPILIVDVNDSSAFTLQT